MKLFLVTLMLLPGLNCGFLTPGDTLCKAMDDATCTVTVGGNVILQIMNNATDFRIRLSKGSKEMFNVKKGTLMIVEDTLKNRTEVFMHNGTIKVKNVQWADAGQYKVGIHYSGGKNLKTVLITLEVKVNPWPTVVIACASAGALLIVALIACCICRKVKTRKHKHNASQGPSMDKRRIEVEPNFYALQFKE